MTTRACFVDFDFPKYCGTWAVMRIVAADVETCIDSGEVFASSGAVLESCDIVLGLESSLVDAFGGVTGPTYNYSRIGASAPFSSSKLTGWEFLMPFSWGVWLVFIGCAVAAFGSQLLMRWLDFRRKKTSPTYVITKDEEKSFDLVMASFTALINATRLYTYYQGPYFRHAASMVMAIFSVFFVSLYSSNLTAFMFPSKRLTLDGATAVHWAISDRPAGASFAPGTAAVPAEAVLIAPDTWLDCSSTSSTFVPLGGAATYPMMYNRGYAPSRREAMSARVATALSNHTWPAPACAASGGGAATELRLEHVWGLFVLAAVGHAAAVAMTLARGQRDFRWFARRSPIADEHDTLDTIADATPPCRKSEDASRGVDMFELSRAWSTSIRQS